MRGDAWGLGFLRDGGGGGGVGMTSGARAGQ